MELEQLKEANSQLRVELRRLREDCVYEADKRHRELAIHTWELLVELDRRQEHIDHLEQLMGYFTAVEKSKNSKKKRV